MYCLERHPMPVWQTVKTDKQAAPSFVCDLLCIPPEREFSWMNDSNHPLGGESVPPNLSSLDYTRRFVPKIEQRWFQSFVTRENLGPMTSENRVKPWSVTQN